MFSTIFSTNKIASNTLGSISIKKPFPPRTSVGSKFDKLYQQKKGIRYFAFFVDQATPGFELGKKDLQSPALPLGHAAKATQNRRKYSHPFFLLFFYF